MFLRRILAAALLIAVPFSGLADSFVCRPDTAPEGVTPRVVGGVPAAHSEAPYQVALKLGVSHCGGSIISRSFVLTAAHCVFDGKNQPIAASDMKVLYGDARKSRSREAKVSAVFAHPGYQVGNPISPNDIAVLRLTRPMEMPEGTVVTLASEPLHRAFVKPGTCARVTGFGRREGGQLSDQLVRAELPVASADACDPKGRLMTGSIICAGYRTGGADSCNGDSGGPLVVREGPARWMQIGIVSFGPKKCGQAGKYGYYTRVASFVDWIMDVTRR